MKNLIIGLVGNQNCGKTTLFNELTGSNQHVGNFPGVTVEKKEGILKNSFQKQHITIVDLPGIYSLSPYSAEEVVTRDFLLSQEEQAKPDAVLNILDATNIERNLYLTLQLMEMQIPMVLALNLMDEVIACGNSIDVENLQKLIGVPVIPIVAKKNEGVNELIDTVIRVIESKQIPEKIDFCTGAVHTAIHSIAHLIDEKAKISHIPLRFASTKIVEGDELMYQQLHLTDVEKDIVTHIVDEMTVHLETDREAALADMRYDFIEKICRETVQKQHMTKEQQRSIKIDALLTHKFLAIPVFLLIMSGIFFLTFGVFGSTLSSFLSLGIDALTNITSNVLQYAQINPVVQSLIINGVFAGVGSVLSFLPTILVLFFFLSLLEDTGYMARVAFVMDKALRKIGLSGKSFVPMLIGLGCSVPAIMATRTLSSARDRKATIMLIPFVSCSAKLPIYALFTASFFTQHQTIVMISLYILGIVVAILVGLVLKLFFKGNPVPFVMELPAYRLPSLKTILIHIGEKAKDFVTKAFTVIFAATLIIWFLQTFDFRLNVVDSSADSILASIGKLAAPIFAPLGFGDWRATTALITGLSAKEAVVSTLAVLFGASGTTGATSISLPLLLSSVFTPLSALTFLVFSLLYMPCIAAFAAVKRELHSFSQAALIMLSQTVLAWLIAYAVYSIGSIIVV